MNKKLQLFLLIMLFGHVANAQFNRYSDTFVVGQSYCPSSSQFDNWVSFRASLDTTTNQFIKITVKGTYDQTGRTCTDKWATRRLAAALKNGTSISVTCNSYTWRTGSPGGCYSGLCGSSTNEVELTVDGTLCSCVTPGYSFRPAITNSNWGGINTATCGGSNQRMTVEFQKVSKNNDAGIASFTNPNLCTNTQSLSATITNFGKFTLDSFRLNWSINGVLQTTRYVKSKLGSIKDTVIIMNPSFAFSNNTSYKFKIWTSRPNGAAVDSVPTNDTANVSINFLGNPNPPTTTDFKQCGGGKPTLTCVPSAGSDSILWFTQSTGGTLLGVGKSLKGPFINKTTTFYAQAMRFGGSSTIGTGFGGNIIITGNVSQYNGSMFNVNVINSVNLDSVTIKLWQNNANTNTRLYYKTGTHVGFETNASAWTLVSSGKVRFFISGGLMYGRMPAKLFLPGGQLYGFYVTTDPTVGGGNEMYVTSGAITSSNSDLSITGSRAVGGLFGSQGVYSTWTANVEFMLSKTCSNPTRTPLKVTVNPRPIGADVIKSSTFQGKFNVGSPSQPDVTEPGKIVDYELLPPTGFTNANFTVKWDISLVEGKTKYGKVLVAGTDYIITTPTGSSNAKLSFRPGSNLCDSLVTFSIKFFDLGPYFCDSTVVRTIKVAPTPKTNFDIPKAICDGDAILFNNLTTIGCGANKDGFAAYKWYFGDGDSADVQNPVHQYKTFGCYPVKLVAISSPWGATKDTTITVCVTELPLVKFKVTNACQGLPVKFANQTTIGSGTLVYSWTFGDGSPITSATNPSHLYTTPGGYKVTLKASANGCESSLSKNAYEFAKPVPNFTIPLIPVCAHEEILFPNSTTILLGQSGSYWTYGDGKYSTLDEGYNTYSTAGNYNVKLKAISEFGCTDSITKTVAIKAAPSPTFVYSKLCSGEPTNFVNTTVENVPNPTYTWTLSDNSSYGTKNITKTWPNEGRYSATLKADFTNGCSGTTTQEFNVLIQPTAAFTVPDICSGDIANYVNKTKGDKGNINYLWDLGNGSSNEASPKRLYTPLTTTTYTVSLIASYNSGCADTTIGLITVSQAPTCAFTVQNLGFLNYQFTPGNSSYKNYDWFFGEGGSRINKVNPTYTYQYAGGFKVKMIATNAAGCKCEVTNFVSANSGLDNIKANNSITIYPNPNNGTFTVTSNSTNGMKIEVYNVLGSRILSQSSTDETAMINLGDVSKGIYLVKVTINGVTSTTKITVTN